MPRAHLYAVAQDAQGNAQENASVRILQPGTENPIADPIYATDTDVAAMPNPFVTVTGLISVYMDNPQRVRIGITPVSAAERFIEDIDVGGSGGGGGDSDHVGGGSGSTKIGLDATSDGANSLAIAQQAAAGGDNSTAAGFGSVAEGLGATGVGSGTVASADRSVAVGRLAQASGTGSIAVGSGTGATAIDATTVGENSIANSANSSALGASASAGHVHATAVGSEAATTEANQIVLGTPADFADAPGGYVLTAVNGIRYRLRVLPDGTLTTTSHVPTTSVNLLPVDEQSFEAGIGAWAAVSGLTSVAQSTDYALAGTHSLKLVLSGSGAASARSSKVDVVPSSMHVGQARMFYHAGAMTAGLNATCWLEFYDDTDTLIGSSVVGRSRMMYADAWVFFDVRAMAPSNAATAALLIGLPTGGGTSGDAFYADSAGIFLVPGSV